MTADVGAERRPNRIAGIAALVAVIASFAGLLVVLSTTTGTGTDDAARRSLLEADESGGALWGATALRVVSLLLLVVAAWQLVRLVAARVAVQPALRWLCVVVPLLMAVGAVLSQLSLLDAADTFVSGGPRTDARADDLLNEGGLQRLSAVAGIIFAVAFAGWLAWLSLAATSAGLLTQTLGYWGVGAGVAMLLVPIAGQGLFLGWLGSVALLLLGWWPGGIGPAWTSGTAEPWQPGLSGRRPREGAT
ncbi:hypothetical protein [Conexibacter sp. SYSU D00693]|uniref:hypothetical protein n=1 Tax=Conexibacter sp. SYSU D00693 TaxID=2812560 RepID=UPI00196BA168|nr:hypothetical protein [Conexibacter sp. SYSU D00693]